jgi:hypothetical protein
MSENVRLHWIWGQARCGEGDAPMCSNCNYAVAPSGMEKHEEECWKRKHKNGQGG